ncbi:uncharacterized protein LOC129770888 [Toxorhynchites rutilus septentrionalis]|uniref:uncharacterized protein LOC129770888 n=1 Tax=Toxorhynchites rutilus septentrionalis TaxID=329112 RepID=UPI002478CFA6|nr:uncharacterized protein LOC129770888 [Toxorhynchites rutilus septentrionalis]
MDMWTCACCPAEQLSERMVHYMNHDGSQADHTMGPDGAAASNVFTEENQQEESYSDYGSSTPVMDISGFITEILLVLRDIRDEQRTNFRTLSKQIVDLRSELCHVRKSQTAPRQKINQRWDPSQYFPISSVEQLMRIDEICERMENFPHIVDFKKTLEIYCRDENVAHSTGFYKIFDETFAIQLIVSEQETPPGYIPLDRYESFYKLLYDTWKLCNRQGKPMDRRLRHFLSLNRKRLATNDDERSDFGQDNSATEIQIRNSFNKRTSSDMGSVASETTAKRRYDGRFVIKKKKHNLRKA